MLWKVLFWKQVLAHPREIPKPALSLLSISTEAQKDHRGSINPQLLWTFRALIAQHGRGLHAPQSELQSLGLPALTGNNPRAQLNQHATSLHQNSTSPSTAAAACLPLCDPVVRIMEQRQACFAGLFCWALQMGIEASEVFLTWCQQPQCRFSSHLQIQSHPFRERWGYSCCNPIPRLSSCLIRGCQIDLGGESPICPWHLSRIMGTLAAAGGVT